MPVTGRANGTSPLDRTSRFRPRRPKGDFPPRKKEKKTHLTEVAGLTRRAFGTPSQVAGAQPITGIELDRKMAHIQLNTGSSCLAIFSGLRELPPLCVSRIPNSPNSGLPSAKF